MTRSVDFAKNVPNHSFYRDFAESILFYNNKKRGFRRELIAEIFRTSNGTNESMASFDDLAYAYFKLFTNSINNGCTRKGLDFSSGCACVPTKNFFPGASTNSTNFPSGEVPETTTPPFSISLRNF